MNRRSFLAGLAGSAVVATPAIACSTFRQLAGFEVEYYSPTQIVIRQGSMSIGTQCNIYSMVKDRVLAMDPRSPRGWYWIWAIGNPKTGTLDFSIQPVFATSTFSRNNRARLSTFGFSDFRMLPVAVFWEGTHLRSWFLEGGYPQPSVWWTETRENDRDAIHLMGSGEVHLADWVPETGRGFYAVVEATGGKARIGTPNHGWIELRPEHGGREIRDVRLLPDASETLRYNCSEGAKIRLWPRGYNCEQPV